MNREISDFVFDGPEQDRRIVAVRMRDGTEIDAGCAIEMIRRGDQMRYWTGQHWRDLGLVQRRMWVTELAA